MKNSYSQHDFFCGETALSAAYVEWYAASFVRFSTRKYLDKPIKNRDREAIDAMIARINQWHDGVRILPVYEVFPDLFESFGYTKLSGVPAFLAILVDKKKYSDVKAGFYGEAVCLFLTSLGLKTCWVSGSIKKQNLKNHIKIEAKERFLTSIAFGYGEERPPEIIEGRRKRKPIEKIFEGEFADDRYTELMRCVQNAPSAINRQPWRFGIKDTHLIVKKSLIPGGPFPEALDIGISMLHASCGAKAQGISGTWRKDIGSNLAVLMDA